MTLSQEEYSARDATALADLVRRREVSPPELLECAIAAADRINPRINAIVRRFDDEAKQRARLAANAGGRLAGVPMLLKDMACGYVGQVVKLGSRFLPDIPAEVDSACVTHFRRAGMIPFGFTNAPEFGLPSFCEPKLYGPARNPHDLGRTSGGSSGGSAAAVASGIVAVAHASDGGGSIRIPAACCGLVGLKPSRGRLSVAPDGEWAAGTGVQGAVTRSVRDAAAMLDIMAGYVPGDPYVSLDHGRDFSAALTGKPARLRIAFSAAPLRGHVAAPECIAATEQAAQLCAAIGHEVSQARPDIVDSAAGAEIASAFHIMYSVSLAALVDRIAHWRGAPPREAEFEVMTWAYYQEGRAHSASTYVNALGMLSWVTRQLAQFFECFDVWLTPTLYSLPPAIGAFDTDAPGATLHDPFFAGFAPACPIYNISGQPAISLPLHWTEAGLPVGVMFGGRYGAEATLLGLSSQLEEAQPWAHRLPAERPAP